MLPGGIVLVARRAAAITQWDFRVLVAQAYRDWDYRGADDQGAPFEPKASDWGMLDGRLVAVDYAATQEFIRQAYPG